MSDFLGRVGRITEWVVVSNLENRAVNAACNKAEGWWKNRKHKKDNKHASSASSTPPTPPPQQKTQANYVHTPPPQQQLPQASYAPSPPLPPPPSIDSGQLSIRVNQVDGLSQWGSLVVIIECNYQRYQTTLEHNQEQFSFPVYRFDHDQLYIWVQTQYQQQTIAHSDIPIRILLNNNNTWTPLQQRWIPLRDSYNAPVGQVLIDVEYTTNNTSAQQMPDPPPPPYPYYS